MQTKLICLDVKTVPESVGARQYYVATFKRVANPKRGASEEQQELAAACPTARVEIGTYDVDCFKVGREYTLTIELVSGIQESLAERIDAAAAVDELKKIEVELNQATLSRAHRAELVTRVSNARKRLSAS